MASGLITLGSYINEGERGKKTNEYPHITGLTKYCKKVREIMEKKKRDWEETKEGCQKGYRCQELKLDLPHALSILDQVKAETSYLRNGRITAGQSRGRKHCTSGLIKDQNI